MQINRMLDELNRTEQRLSGIIASALDPIITIDERHEITLVNAAVEQMFGYSEADLLGKPISMLIPERYHAAHEQHLENFSRTNLTDRAMGRFRQIVGRRADGGEFPIDASISQMEWAGQRLSTVILRDVTRRIEAEKALRESEARLRLAVDSGGVGLWEWDIATDQMTWTGQLNAIFGLPEDSERLTLTQALGAIHPDDRAEVERAHATALENRTECDQVFRILRPDGEVRWIGSKGHGVYDPGGQPVCMIGAALDITERKQAQQTLRKNYELLDRIFATTHFCLVYLDRDLNFVRVNKAYADACGHPPEFFVGRNHFDLYPGARVEAIFRNVVATGTPFTINANPFQFPDHPERGVTYWDWTLHPLRNEEGRVEGLLFALLDVTERWRIEEVNARLAAIVEHSNDAIISRGPDRAILTWNAAAERLFGYTAAEAIGRNVSLLIPADQEARAVQVRALLEDGLSVPTYDAVRLGKDGRRIDVSITASPIKNSSGKMTSISLVFRDIGERKRAEVEHAQLGAIVESSNDAILIRGPDRTILSWNAAAERLFGWSAQEAVGQSIDLIVPPERSGMLQPFVERVAGGESVSPVETTHLRKDGVRIATQVTFSPVRDGDGNVIAHSCTVRDMSELKRKEETLRSYTTRLRELSRRLREVEETERHAISRELHDRIGQELSTLTLLFGKLATRLTEESPSAVQSQLKDMQGLLKSTVGNVRDIMAELRPPVLDDYGLHAALRQLATEFAKHSGISVELIGVDLQPRLPSIVETAMFRICQEALNNAGKHARAKKVEISLSEASERVVLDIADDGVGFDASETRQDRQHWGMITMRERAEVVGITLRLESAPGAGTRIVLEVERTAT